LSAKKDDVPSDFGEGSPVEEKIALEGMRSLENKLKSSAQQYHESFSRRARQNKKLIEGFKKFDIDLKAIVSEAKKDSDQDRQRAHDTYEKKKGIE
jgi:hypothetical protein